jgi:electron transport complex protein RnfG
MNDTKQMIKNAFVLFAITLIAGVLLGFVYQITKEPIAYQQQLALDKANQAVFTDATTFNEIEIDTTALSEIIASDSNYSKIDITNVLEATDDSGNVLGYVLQLSSMGYGDDIEFALGITNDGVINGLSIISINETPGLGMNAEKVLVPQFASKQATQFTVNKNGATSDSEITAISGATITSNAVTRAVNVGVAYFENVLKGGQ